MSRWCLAAVMGFVLVACQLEKPVPQSKGTVGTTRQAVVGGQIDNRLPAVGALVANQRSFCTGTLIASRLVVTAAHCVTAAQQYIDAGQKVQFRIDLPTGQGTNYTATYHDVDIVKAHPQYAQSGGTLVNDVGYVTLRKDVTGVTPIPLNTTKLDNAWVGRKVLFLGYGLIETTPQLKSAGRKYGAEITMRTVSSDRIQTQDQGKSICSGDSGGPGLYDFNGEIRIIAVNSYVTGRTSGRQPLCDGSGWSFRVDYFASWLQPLINQYGGKCKADKDCGPCYRCDATQGKCVLKGTTPTQEFCQPCRAPNDCGGSGQNICHRQSVGNRCLQACDANGCCPLGTSCRIVGGSSQCVPNSNVCADVKCQADTDCGPGEQCTNGVCSPKPVQPAATLCKTCASDADCGNGGVCTDYPDGKRCTQPCVADNFCPQGYACKVMGNTSQCVAVSGECACKANTDCHQGFACQSGICLRVGGGKYGDACDNKRTCASGYSCTQTHSSGNICIQTCTGLYDPGQPGSLCAKNQCVEGSCTQLQGGSACMTTCNSDADCKNGGSCQRLGRSFSVCICQSDSHCKNGTTCNESLFGSFGFGLCAQKRNAKSECEAGFECRSAGGANFCLPGATQQAGDDCDESLKRCKSGHVCAQTESGGALCIRECVTDNDCQPEGGSCTRNGNVSFCSCNQLTCSDGYACKPISSRNKLCVRNICASDADCSGGLVCQGGKCQSAGPPQCSKDSDCPQKEQCQGGKCVPKPECVSDGDCGAGQECTSGKCVPKQNATCASHADCQQGYVCRDTKCVPEDSCNTSPDCKTGYVCEFNVCVKDTSPQPPEPPAADAGTTDKPATTDKNGTVDKGTTTDTPAIPIDRACGCTAQPSKLPTQSVLWLLLLLPFLGMRRRR